MNKKIYISTYGEKVIKIKDSIPIEVGSSNRNFFVYNLHDNTGDNISGLNETFGELTGLYWVWKNVLPKCDDNDVIGYCHYNKAFYISEKHLCLFFEHKLENKSDWITLTPVKNREHKIKSEIVEAERLLKKSYDLFYKEWKNIYNEDGSGKRNVCRPANMFITTAKNTNDYCNFLFDYLLKLYEIIGKSKCDEYSDRRYCAFIGERLLSVYLLKNAINPLEVKPLYKQKYYSLFKKIAEKGNFDKSSLIYKKLKKMFGYKSSYGRYD